MKDVVQLGTLSGLNKSRIPPRSLGKLPAKKAPKTIKPAVSPRVTDQVVVPVLPELVFNEVPVEHSPPFSEPESPGKPQMDFVEVSPTPVAPAVLSSFVFPDELLIKTPEPELTPPELELPLEEPEAPKKKKKKEEPSDQPIELDLKAENTPA